ENPFPDAKDEGVFDSGCSRSMTGNKERLNDFQAFQGEKVTFGGGEGRITGKGTIQTPTLDFENVYYVKELQQFNLFSISQICDKKNRVLFTDTECLMLSKDFKLPDEIMMVLRVPRKHNLYTINLNNLCSRGNLACLVAHTSVDESVKWHRRMGHVNYKNMNRLVKGNLVRGLPPKIFKNDHTCVACCKGKQHKASYKAINATEAVRTAYYVLNRVLVTSPHKKTPYALLTGNIPSVSHFKPFGCHVTILNTSDHLGKFDGKADEGYIVGYSVSNKAYRVYNVHNKKVEESMNVRFLEEKPNVQGTQGATTNPAGTQDADSDSDYDEQVIIVPSYPSHNIQGTEPKVTSGDKVDDSLLNSGDKIFQKELARLKVPPGSIPVPTGYILVPAGATMVSTDDIPIHTSSLTDSFFDDEPTTRFPYPSDLGNHDPSPGIFSSSSYDDEFGVALNNVASTVEVSLMATTRINTIHPQSLIIRDPTLAVRTRSKVKQNTTDEYAFISYINDQQRDNHTDFQHYLFACFLSQVEPYSVAQALKDPSWVDAMQEEMQQFKFQNVWVLVDLHAGKYAIGTKSILKNKRDARGIVVRNKARLVAQGHRQEEGIDYDEVFAPVARIEVIRLFLAFASYMGFMVYQMDVKSAFLYGIINEENNRDIILVQVYVDDIIFGSTKKAWCDEFEALMKGEFQMSGIGELTFFLEAVKKIFKYLKGQHKLGLCYPRESPFVLEAYSDSDYAGANKDRKSTTGGCQFLGRRLILWQCKK
nr:putative ribonuclease H-like domain-containing protein [Tanacetum cinerariifolium]